MPFGTQDQEVVGYGTNDEVVSHGDLQPLEKTKRLQAFKEHQEAASTPTSFLDRAISMISPEGWGGLERSFGNVGSDLLNQPGRAINLASTKLGGSPLVAEYKGVTPEMLGMDLKKPSELDRAIYGAQGIAPDVGQGITESLVRGGLSLTEPNTLVTLPAFGEGGLANVAKALIAGQMASQLPEQAAKLGTTLGTSDIPTQEKAKQATDLGIQGLVAGSITKSLVPKEVKTGAKPTITPTMEYLGPTLQDRMEAIQDRPGIKLTRPFEPIPVVGKRGPITFEDAKPKIQVKIPEVVEGQGVSGEPKQGGQISFEGQGIPSAMQAQAMVPNNIIKNTDQLSGKKFFSGVPIDPEDLRPAVRLGGKLYIGEQGETHADIIKKVGGDVKETGAYSKDRGFVDAKNPGEFLDRQTTQQRSGIAGTAVAGGVDSLDLPGAKMETDKSVSDYQHYTQLQDKFRAAPMEEKFKMSGEIEKLKNKHGGKPPPEFSQNMPNVPEGMMRVYHGEGGAVGGGTGGSWSTVDPTRAASFGEKVSYVDLPKAEVDEGKLRARQGGSGTASDVLLSNEQVKGLKATKEAKQQVHEVGDVEKTLTPAIKAFDPENPSNTKYFTGETHALANAEAVKNKMMPDGRTQGFLDESGAFKTRQEAIPIYNELGGKSLRNKAGLMSEDLKDAGLLGHLEGQGGGMNLYSGIPLPEMKKAWDAFSKWARGSATGPPASWTPNFTAQDVVKGIFGSQEGSKLESRKGALPSTELGAQSLGSRAATAVGNKVVNTVAGARNLASKASLGYSPMDVLFDKADGGKATYDGPLFQYIRWPMDFAYNGELNLRNSASQPVRQAVKALKFDARNGERLKIYAAVQEGQTARLIQDGYNPQQIRNVTQTIIPDELRVYNIARNQAQGLGTTLIKQDRPLRGLDFFDSFDEQVQDAAHERASGPLVRFLKQVVDDPRFKQKYGDMYQSQIANWLDSYSKQGKSVSELRPLNALRRMSAVGQLGLRPTSMIIHSTNIPLGMQRAGGFYSQGMKAAISTVGQDFLKKNLAETFERGGGEIETYQGKTPVERVVFAVPREIDRWNSQATALGVYMKELERAGKDPKQWATLPVDQRALAEARVQTRRAVASPLYKDLPPTLRTEAGKLLLQYQNTFADQWSNIRYDFPQYFRDNPRKAATLGLALTAMLMAETGIKYEEKKLRHKAVAAITGVPTKENPKDDYDHMLWEETVKRVPGAQQVSSMAEYGSSGVPVVDTVKEGVQATAQGIKAAASGDKPTRDIAEAKAVSAGLGAVGVPGAGYGGQVAQDIIKAKEFRTHEQRIEEVAKSEGLDTHKFSDRVKAEKDYKKTRPKTTIEEDTKAAIGAAKKMEEHKKAILNGLGEDDKKFLRTYGIKPPGFGDSLSSHKTRITLTDDEVKFAEGKYREAYSTVIANLRNDPRFKRMSPEDQEKLANREFHQFQTKTRKEVDKAIESGTVPKAETKRKRFSIFSQ